MKKFVFVAIAALFSSSLALAGVQDGIDAFRTKQFDTALKELRPAADAGDPAAMYYLGQMYATGFGVDKDLKKALAFYRKAAELGHADSQRELGTALALGEGIEQDVREGLKWLFIAAKAGDESAKEYGKRFSKFMSRTVVLSARKEATEWQAAFNRKNAAAEPTTPTSTDQ